MVNKRVYYGVYDGQVCAINDPEKRGRIQCVIPDVTGESPSAWCEPCVPVAYDDGGDFYLPKLKEFVWIMFEQGDPNKPVYFGGWWAMNRTPLADNYDTKKTDERIISFKDCLLRMSSGKFEVSIGGNDAEIVVENNKVSIVGLDKEQSDWNEIDDTKGSFIKNKPTIPNKISDLQEDSTHRSITDTEKTTWNNKSDFSGSYNDLTDKPSEDEEKNGLVKTTSALYQLLKTKGYINSVFSVDLQNHGEWIDSGTTVNNYKVYKSNASYNVNNAWDTAKITFKGYSTFRIFIRSFAEGTYDYCLVSTLNNDYLAERTTTSAMRSKYSDTTYTKAYTRGKQSNTNYEEVVFDNLDETEEYYFYIIYQKDNSTNKDDDRGYFYIPMTQITTGLENPIYQNDVIKLLVNELL